MGEAPAPSSWAPGTEFRINTGTEPAPEMQAPPGTYRGHDMIRGGPGVWVQTDTRNEPYEVPAGHTWRPRDDGTDPESGHVTPDGPDDPKTVPYTPPLDLGLYLEPPPAAPQVPSNPGFQPAPPPSEPPPAPPEPKGEIG